MIKALNKQLDFEQFKIYTDKYEKANKTVKNTKVCLQKIGVLNFDLLIKNGLLKI